VPSPVQKGLSVLIGRNNARTCGYHWLWEGSGDGDIRSYDQARSYRALPFMTAAVGRIVRGAIDQPSKLAIITTAPPAHIWMMPESPPGCLHQRWLS